MEGSEPKGERQQRKAGRERSICFKGVCVYSGVHLGILARKSKTQKQKNSMKCDKAGFLLWGESRAFYKSINEAFFQSREGRREEKNGVEKNSFRRQVRNLVSLQSMRRHLFQGGEKRWR